MVVVDDHECPPLAYMLRGDVIRWTNQNSGNIVSSQLHSTYNYIQLKHHVNQFMCGEVAWHYLNSFTVNATSEHGEDEVQA
jgi:hypothetical protein